MEKTLQNHNPTWLEPSPSGTEETTPKTTTHNGSVRWVSCKENSSRWHSSLACSHLQNISKLQFDVMHLEKKKKCWFERGLMLPNSMMQSYKYPYRWFHRAHGLCLYIGLLVAPLNTVKVMSNEVGLRLLCCGMCFTYMHLFVEIHHNISTFPKGFVE